MSALWLFSSIIVERTCTEEWEYRAINREEQISSGLPRGPMLDKRDFAIQLFASLVPHKFGARPKARSGRGEIARLRDPHCERRMPREPSRVVQAHTYTHKCTRKRSTGKLLVGCCLNGWRRRQRPRRRSRTEHWSGAAGLANVGCGSQSFGNGGFVLEDGFFPNGSSGPPKPSHLIQHHWCIPCGICAGWCIEYGRLNAAIGRKSSRRQRVTQLGELAHLLPKTHPRAVLSCLRSRARILSSRRRFPMAATQVEALAAWLFASPVSVRNGRFQRP